MTKDISGIEKAREVKNKLKNEIVVEKISALKKAIAVAQLSPEALAYMEKHNSTGVEDLNTGVSIPMLRVHTTNVSTKNVLANGRQPDNGQIFHTGLQMAWDSVPTIFLSIKKCRLHQIDEFGNMKRDEETGAPLLKAHYLVAGVLDETLAPFVIYVKGMSYNKIWDLEQQLSPYVTKRAGGIPLSMVKIMVGSDVDEVPKGKYKGQQKNVLKFDLLMHESGEFPVLEADPNKLKLLEKATLDAEAMLDHIIENKGITEKDYNSQKQESEELTSTVKSTIIDSDVEDADIENDDVPF